MGSLLSHLWSFFIATVLPEGILTLLIDVDIQYGEKTLIGVDIYS